MEFDNHSLRDLLITSARNQLFKGNRLSSLNYSVDVKQNVHGKLVNKVFSYE